MNFKRLIAGVIIVTLLYGGNIIYYQMQQLSGPFFLKHYYDFELDRDGTGYIDLYYVNNKKDDTSIWYISVPDVEFAMVRNEYVHQDMSHYQVKKATVELSGVDLIDPLAFETLQVQFSNENSKDYPIGQIILRPSSYIEGERPIEFLASGSSNNQTNFSVFELAENLQMKGIEYSFKDLLEDQFVMYFDHQSEHLDDLKNMFENKREKENYDDMNELLWQQNGVKLEDVSFPIDLEKGSAVKVNSGFQFKNETFLMENAYQFEVRLMFENGDGNVVSARDHINYQPYLTSDVVKQLNKKVGGRNE